MESKARIRIAVNGGEFEIEGTEDFVNSYADTIKSFTKILKEAPSSAQSEQEAAAGRQFSIFESAEPKPSSGTPNGKLTAASFGELYYKAPKSISKTDIVLLASYYIQSKNDEGTFTTQEVNKLLREHGIDLTNTSHFNKLNQDYKKVFKMRQGRYKVSEEGVDHLKTILR
ncbi:hypothetical protein OKW21_005648 [Catalinimonas alkaloidigena]|uniref:hypothetical protein n=1 Tax=Catalinimonas alkaloidigena TaxID=1075417 RepID=UPI002406691C|nr:hypothetical protein [Catalinimonas alkaloidigena]MDF9800385.1 hypothetical protein [Catalinimonas alkaloidigena]